MFSDGKQFRVKHTQTHTFRGPIEFCFYFQILCARLCSRRICFLGASSTDLLSQTLFPRRLLLGVMDSARTYSVCTSDRLEGNTFMQIEWCLIIVPRAQRVCFKAQCLHISGLCVCPALDVNWKV